jgi:hypothetical protein
MGVAARPHPVPDLGVCRRGNVPFQEELVIRSQGPTRPARQNAEKAAGQSALGLWSRSCRG